MQIINKPNNMENTTLLICECSSAEHQLIIRVDEEEKEAYCSIHLAKMPFFERLVLGIKYIFGYSCKYGHFEEVVLNDKHASELQKIVDQIK